MSAATAAVSSGLCLAAATAGAARAGEVFNRKDELAAFNQDKPTSSRGVGENLARLR